jgi:hypothetical protein
MPREEIVFSETGAEFRARILQLREASRQGAVDVRLSIDPDPDLVDVGPEKIIEILVKREKEKVDSTRALMKAPAIHGGTGGARRRSRKKRLRPTWGETAQWCSNCQERKTSDLEVCQECGSLLKTEPKGPPRHARIPPEYKKFLENSRATGLQLCDIIEFVTHTHRWKNGDLREWGFSFDCGKQRERAEPGRRIDEESGESGDRGGRPKNYGRWRGEKVQGRLPLSLEAELERGGLSFEPGARLHFTALCLMAFEIYEELLGILKRPPGWGIDPATPIPEEGAIALLSSSPEECKVLSAIMDSPDFDAAIAAALQRKNEDRALRDKIGT